MYMHGSQTMNVRWLPPKASQNQEELDMELVWQLRYMLCKVLREAALAICDSNLIYLLRISKRGMFNVHPFRNIY